MSPAILLCPSSSAVHLWGQVFPLKKSRRKEGSFSLSHDYPRCAANAHFTGVFKRRQEFFFHPASSAEKCRQPRFPFAWRRVSAAAAGGEISVDEAAAVSDEASAGVGTSNELSTSNEATSAATEEASVATERKTQARRTLNRSNSSANKTVVVSPAELIPGAVFPGKVTSIQTFGAFVDLGAFTNGLVHISRLSKSYVKKVEDVVQVGQDVKVQILEVDNQANRISLMLVEEGREEAPQEGEASQKQSQRSSQPQARTPRRESSKRSPSQKQQAVMTTMKKGEICTGTVKNIIKSGVFITLPDGTDGYLPGAEVVFKGPNTNMEAQFQVGQELTVRVLRIEKGRVSLTMKREVNFDKLNEDLNKGVVDGATNPFEIAFRRNELIASFLSERDKQKVQAEEAKKEEVLNSVEEGKDAAPVVMPALKEDEEKVARSTDTAKAEVVTTESVEKVKDAAQAEKPAVEEVEEKVANGGDAKKDEAVSSKAVDSVEEVKDVVEENSVVEEEEEVTNAVDTTKEEAAVLEAVNSIDEVKDKAGDENQVVEEEEDTVTNADPVDTMKEEAVASEAVNSVEKVEDGAEEEKPIVQKREEKVTNEIHQTKDIGVVLNAVSSVEEVKDAAEEEKRVVEEAAVTRTVSFFEEVKDTAEKEKPVVEDEEEKVANVVETIEATSEVVDSVEEAKDVTEVDKVSVEEEKEKKEVANGVDATKDEVVSSEAGAENIITVV